MLLMYSILNWSSGFASGTGGIKVLIADTIVFGSQVGSKKKTYISIKYTVSTEPLTTQDVILQFTTCVELIHFKKESTDTDQTYHYGILHVFSYILYFQFLFSVWGQEYRCKGGTINQAMSTTN